MDYSAVNFTIDGASTNITIFTFIDVYILSLHFMFNLLVHSCITWFLITGGGLSSEIFNLNLSVCEIMFALTFLSFIFIKRQTITLLSDVAIGLALTGRPLFQCLMCVERYLAVVHPVIFLKTKPLRYRVICCAVAWIIIVGSCLFCTFNLILMDLSIFAWFFAMELFFFLFIQLFCLLSVLKALKQSGPGERRRDKDEENPIKRKAFCLILLTTVSMIIMQMPYTVSAIFTAVAQIPFELQLISFMCFMLAGLVQPFLYLHRTGKLSCLCLSNFKLKTLSMRLCK